MPPQQLFDYIVFFLDFICQLKGFFLQCEMCRRVLIFEEVKNGELIMKKSRLNSGSVTKECLQGCFTCLRTLGLVCISAKDRDWMSSPNFH